MEDRFRMIDRRSFLTGATLTPLTLSGFAAATAADMPLVAWAQRLVGELAPENNVYGSHPTYVIWGDAASGRAARNRSVCSSFISHLLEQSYGFRPPEIATWFRKPNPQAEDYYDAIVAGRGFRQLERIIDIQAGDLIAVRYPVGSRPTGHVMLAVGLAVPVIKSVPLRANTSQWTLTVIDSSHSPHGPDDTRRRRGGTTTGVGSGELRLYANPDFSVAGYTWSTLLYSLFRPESERHVALGRLDLASAPSPTGKPGALGRRVTDDSGKVGDDAAGFDD